MMVQKHNNRKVNSLPLRSGNGLMLSTSKTDCRKDGENRLRAWDEEMGNITAVA